MTKKQEELDSVSMVLLHYGNRCAMQNGHGSETPAKDYRDAKDNIYKIINSEVLSVLDATISDISQNQKGQFEDDAGYICWYLDDLIKAMQEMRGRYE